MPSIFNDEQQAQWQRDGWVLVRGCFDAEDELPSACTRSLRIGWVNATRGPGCYLHSNGHGFEAVGRGGTLPMLRPQFVDFAGFDLDTRYGLPFADWYACPYGPDACLEYPSETSVAWSVPSLEVSSGTTP